MEWKEKYLNEKTSVKMVFPFKSNLLSNNQKSFQSSIKVSLPKKLLSNTFEIDDHRHKLHEQTHLKVVPNPTLTTWLIKSKDRI